MITSLQPRRDESLAQVSSQIPDLLRRVRRVLAVVLLLLLLAASLAFALALPRLSAPHGVRADGIPFPTCPKPCASITAMRADGGPTPLPWPGSGTLVHLRSIPVLAQSTMAVVN